MKLARVIGTLVASQCYEGLDGVKFLAVEPLDQHLKADGRIQIAADATGQAGPDDVVFVVGSREAAQAMPNLFVPVDLAITGIVDDVNLDTGRRRDQPTAIWRIED